MLAASMSCHGSADQGPPALSLLTWSQYAVGSCPGLGELLSESAGPLGTTRLRGGIMRANVNYNVEADEEAGVLGQISHLQGRVANSGAAIAMLQNISIY